MAGNNVPPYTVPVGQNTPYEYIGDDISFGSPSLLMLAKSYEEIFSSNIDDLFPDVNIPERTVIVETEIEGIGTLAPVSPTVPIGQFLPPSKVMRKSYEPFLIRGNEFIDNYSINQLLKPGSYSEIFDPKYIIDKRLRRLMNYRMRTITMHKVMVLLGGINYLDPRTNVTLDVPTHIPAHNLFRYDGYSEDKAEGDSLGYGGLVAAKALTNNKGRKEALFFTNVAGQAGVPWTDPNADIIKALRYIKHYLYETNKNMYTEIIMSHALWSIIQDNNLIKAYAGSVGIVAFDSTAASPDVTKRSLTTLETRQTPASIGFGAGGDIVSIAGLNIRLMTQTYSDPATEGGPIKNMWPNHKVAIVAKNHINEPMESLGYTHHCIGEGPNQEMGLWVFLQYQHTPPYTPGVAMQLGDAYLPYAKYPQWISIIDVCEPEDIGNNIILGADANLAYGTF
jgi:hypothetical protein